MPGIVQFWANLASQNSIHPSKQSDNPEDLILWLPSCIPSSACDIVCRPGLTKIEEKLCDAQLQDSLDGLCRTLRVKTRMIQFKNKNIRGQRGGTRSRMMIDRVHEKARLAVDKYCAGRSAKLALAGNGDWEKNYQVLNNADVRGYQDPNKLRVCVGRQGIWEDGHIHEEPSQAPGHDQTSTVDGDDFLLSEARSRHDGTGETCCTLSWIWLSSTLTDSDNVNNDDILRVEWSKSHARAERAKEEVLLLQEEMQRVLAYLDWKAGWWRERDSLCTNTASDLAEGIKGYALAQADIQESLGRHFKKLWALPLNETLEKIQPNNTYFSAQNEDVRDGDNTFLDDDDNNDDNVNSDGFADDEQIEDNSDNEI